MVLMVAVVAVPLQHCTATGDIPHTLEPIGVTAREFFHTRGRGLRLPRMVLDMRTARSLTLLFHVDNNTAAAAVLSVSWTGECVILIMCVCVSDAPPSGGGGGGGHRNGGFLSLRTFVRSRFPSKVIRYLSLSRVVWQDHIHDMKR